jgi:uncharacterized protein (DUF362 family)
MADIYRTIPADLSFLDLTSVAEAAGVTLNVRPVGLMLASTDAVALDTVAKYAIGYDDVPTWVSYYGVELGVGCYDMGQVQNCGDRLEQFPKASLETSFESRATQGLALCADYCCRQQSHVDLAGRRRIALA